MRDSGLAMTQRRNNLRLTTTPRRDAALMVGREREQVFLREELAAANAGHGRFVLFGGEAGIGKTTLARDLAQTAVAQNALVLSGNCYDLTNAPPYGPWLDLAANYVPAPAEPQLPAAFAGGVLARVTDQAVLVADVRRFLTELTGNGPVLVLLEDLHWADPASLDLLRRLGPHLGRLPTLVVATYRVDDLTRHHPLYQQLPALMREAGGWRLDLRRLDVTALRELVATRYGLLADDEARLVAYLDRRAEGNPFFTTELLRTLEEEGLLNLGEDGWTLDELERVMVPPFLRQVIDGRVARLGEAVRKSLAVAAVIGQEVPLALWREIAALDDETLLATVEQAVETSLLSAEHDGSSVRFIHALTREALYEGVVPPRRRLVHQQTAEALMQGPNPGPDAVAYHLQQAGDDRAGEWLVRAADRAQRAYAWLTAADRLRDAADLLAPMPGEEDHRCRLLYRLARLKRFSLPIEAIAAVDEAELLAMRLDDPILTCDVLFSRGVALCYANQFRAGLAALLAAAEMLEAMPLATARDYYGTSGAWLADAPPETVAVSEVIHQASTAPLDAAVLRSRWPAHHWMAACAGRVADAAVAAERDLASLSGSDDSLGLRFSTAYTHHALGFAHAALARPDEARAAWRTARAIYDEFDHHALHALTLLAELRDVALSFGAADPAARRGLAARAEAMIERAGGAFRPGISARLAWLGCLILDGRWRDTARILSTLSAPGNAFLEREVTAASAELARHRGMPDSAWERITTALPDGPETPPGDRIHQEGLFLQRLAADLCLDAGDHSGAFAWLSAHDQWLVWSGAVLGQAAGRLTWARYHAAAADHRTARAGAAEALALAAAPAQPLVQLAALRLLGDIDAASGDFPQAEAALTASLALAGQCETPYERALTLLSVAEMRVGSGEDLAAQLALEEAREICLPLEATPALARVATLTARVMAGPRGDPNPAGLTVREAEVLRLLMQRRTDKEIADTLFLGARTVQSHVARIFDKLGVANRREAALAAERIGFV